MELPHLGHNCALTSCNRLDFLPVKCDACFQVFCIEHYPYDGHSCEKSKSRDVQVPVCPLCSGPVASRKGQLPDIAVSEHMDKYCKANEAIKNQISKPKTSLQSCNFKSCKQKDLIYLECKDCCLKFCIKHRHPIDHQCSGPASLSPSWSSIRESCSNGASSSYSMLKNKAQQISKSGQAALNRLTKSQNNTANGVRHANNQNVSALQGNLSESEALAIAMRESTKNNILTTQEDQDLALARALSESESEARLRQQANRNKDNCVLS